MQKSFNQSVFEGKRMADHWSAIRFLWYNTNVQDKQRRANILRVLASNDMPVNAKHYIQVKHDKQLQKLIKQGKVKIVRRPYGSCISKPTTTKQWAILVK